MGFFRSVPVTVTDCVEKDQGDINKAEGVLQENATHPAQHDRVDPDAEKAVVHKLDWRVVTLLYVMCIVISGVFSMLSKLTSRPVVLLSFLERSNIG